MTQNKERKDKVIHLRLEPSKFIEAKQAAEKAGYPDVSQYLRRCLFERDEVEAFKQERARVYVEEMAKFRIMLSHLRAAGFKE